MQVLEYTTYLGIPDALSSLVTMPRLCIEAFFPSVMPVPALLEGALRPRQFITPVHGLPRNPSFDPHEMYKVTSYF